VVILSGWQANPSGVEYHTVYRPGSQVLTWSLLPGRLERLLGRQCRMQPLASSVSLAYIFDPLEAAYLQTAHAMHAMACTQCTQETE
jgi:hypothetical protein